MTSSSSSSSSSSCSNQSTNTFSLSDLSSWITSHGGFVHPSLSLRDDEPTKKSTTTTTTTLPSSSTLIRTTTKTTTTPSIRSRGIITTNDIPNGTLLIRLPSSLALSGRNLPPPPSSSSSKKKISSSMTPSNFPSTQIQQPSLTPPPSPWLRTLTHFLLVKNKKTPQQQQQQQHPSSSSSSSIDYSPYLSSLPLQFTTLSSWTVDDFHHLIGTTLYHLTTQDKKNDGETTERQTSATRYAYERRVRPFLANYYLDDDDDDDDDVTAAVSYDDFLWAAGGISTRAFHCCKKNDDADYTSSLNDDDDDDDDGGPYLLPFIDLLNHSQRDKCTTLRRETANNNSNDDDDDDDDFFFVMRLERNVSRGEEILHSYGDDLTAGQFLRTFGFVPREVTVDMVRRWRRRRRTTGDDDDDDDDDDDGEIGGGRRRRLTPSVLTRGDLMTACRFVAFSKDVVGDLKELLLGGRGEEVEGDVWWDASESWQSKVDYLTGAAAAAGETSTTTTSSSSSSGGDDNNNSSHIMIDLPNDFLIPFPIDDDNMDDIQRIVTCSVMLLLPDASSITELFHDGFSLLDEMVIFQDYYLGHLVVRSLLRAIATKESSYYYGDDGGAGATTTTTTMMDDVAAVEDCLRRYEELDVGDVRKMEALTVRMEERWCLERLKGRVLGWLERLERDHDDDDDDDDGSCREASDCKRVKR